MEIKELRYAAQNDALGLARRYHDDDTYDYIGLAAPGTGTDETKWRIARVKQSNGDTDHPNGSADFVHEWDEVLNYDYS